MRFVRAIQKVAEGLAHRICRALVPARVLRRLLSGKNLNEAISKTVKLVAARDVAVQRLAVKLGQNVDLAKTAVKAIADRDIDQTIFTAQWHRRLRALLGQGKKAGTGAAAHNNGQSFVLEGHHINFVSAHGLYC